MTKIVALFMERTLGQAEVSARLLQASVAGIPVGAECGSSEVGGFVLGCPVSAKLASWGRVKASFR